MPPRLTARRCATARGFVPRALVHLRLPAVRATNLESVFQQWYSGIGNLVATDWQAIGELNRYVEQYAIDPLGNVVLTETGDGLKVIGAPGNEPRIKRYEPGQARVIAMSHVVPPDSGSSFQQDSTAQWYDDAGNLLGSYTSSESAHSESQSKHFYGADNRLRVVQRVAVRGESESYDPELSGVWEEYRYDPLGRRIMVRTRRDGDLCNQGPNVCASTITRFVWSGDDLLWELKAAGGEENDLEATTGAGLTLGMVSYTHGGGIDRPLALHKEGYRSLVPHETWRGQFSDGTCVVNGGAECGVVPWPGWRTTAYHAMVTPPETENWRGGLVDGMRDATGQMYRRNRYYDPQTGQFTQPDPIGLAGGLNAYGFAAGDPVTYSDPYGLAAEAGCPPICNDSNLRHLELQIQQAQSGDESIMAIGELVRGGRVRATINRHANAISEAAAANGVDPALIKGIIFEEQTHQFPIEGALEARGVGSTVGLGQMTVGTHGTRQQLLNPIYNIQAMARHLGALQAGGLIDANRPVASLATKYNCGKCTSISPYGERVEKSHQQFSSP